MRENFLDSKQDENQAPDTNAGLFGFNHQSHESKICIIPVPWEATTSYGRGTAAAPHKLIKASHQLDLLDPAFGEVYQHGICLLEQNHEISRLNTQTLRLVEELRTDPSRYSASHLQVINDASNRVNKIVELTALDYLQQGKSVAVLGGDHSSPFGLIKAIASQYEDFGILHIDAHYDLREAYEGCKFSHASIMYNILTNIPEVSQIVHLGIRDYCTFEKEFADSHPSCHTLDDRQLFNLKAQGKDFHSIAQSLIDKLPDNVYISFDIDGLNPFYCPGTGTPVPGGLEFNEAAFVLELLAQSGKKIIGFDLCEIANPWSKNEWDFNVGARLLYKLCGALVRTQT